MSEVNPEVQENAAFVKDAVSDAMTSAPVMKTRDELLNNLKFIRIGRRSIGSMLKDCGIENFEDLQAELFHVSQKTSKLSKLNRDRVQGAYGLVMRMDNDQQKKLEEFNNKKEESNESN